MTARVSLLGVVLLFLGNSGAASGAQAVFTRDGAQVYVISGPKREKLERVDLNERRISSVALPPSKGEVVLVDLSMDATGRLLLITPNELWQMEGAEQKWTKLQALEPGGATPPSPRIGKRARFSCSRIRERTGGCWRRGNRRPGRCSCGGMTHRIGGTRCSMRRGGCLSPTKRICGAAGSSGATSRRSSR